MNAKLRQVNIKKFSFTAVLFIGLLGLVGLQGCSDSNSITETPDTNPTVTIADANGLFNGTGKVNNGTDLTKVRGFVHEGRFMFFDEDEAVLYDGTIDSVNGIALTATVTVYKDGARVSPDGGVSATGTFTGAADIEVIMTGTGYGAGTITLLYDLLYERNASFDLIAANGGNIWVGDAHTPNTTTSGSVFLLSSEFGTRFAGFTGTPSSCDYDNGDASIPDAENNIYLINSDSLEQGSTCGHIGTGFTGFLAVVDDAGLEATLLFASANGEFASFSVLERSN